MLVNFLRFFFICLLPQGLSAAIRLHFLPGVPAQLTSTLSIEMNESLPVLNLTSSTKQMIKSDLVAIQGQSQAPAAPPAGIIFSLKDLFIDLKVNKESTAFDPRTERGAVPLMQLSKILHKPLYMVLNKDGELIPDPQQIEGISKEFPALQEIDFETLLNEWFVYIFALINQDLEEGATYHQKMRWMHEFAFPDEISYTIKKITDKEVISSIEGRVPSAVKVIENDGKSAKVRVEADGVLTGEISWDRNNAMFCDFHTQYICHAKLKDDDKEWELHISMTHKASTR